MLPVPRPRPLSRPKKGNIGAYIEIVAKIYVVAAIKMEKNKDINGDDACPWIIPDTYECRQPRPSVATCRPPKEHKTLLDLFDVRRSRVS